MLTRCLSMLQRTNKQNEKIIRDAIRDWRCLLFEYNGVQRTVQPHILGVDRGGHLALSGWQTKGTGVGWRLFHLDNIVALGLSDRRFHHPASGYNPADAAFAQVMARLEASLSIA